MTAAHTPGPWQVIVDAHGEVTVYEATTRDNTDICTMAGNNNDGANARLIAAAPNLLATLKYAAQPMGLSQRDFQTWLAVAQGIIALAEGNAR
jgi:hypothetical protein